MRHLRNLPTQFHKPLSGKIPLHGIDILVEPLNITFVVILSAINPIQRCVYIHSESLARQRTLATLLLKQLPDVFYCDIEFDVSCLGVGAKRFPKSFVDVFVLWGLVWSQTTT